MLSSRVLSILSALVCAVFLIACGGKDTQAQKGTAIVPPPPADTAAPVKLGNTTNEAVFEESFAASEGMQRVKRGGFFGYINTVNGRIVGWYEEAEDFHQDQAHVKKGGRSFWINKSGTCVKDCQ